MVTRLTVGVDPGLTGAIAVLDPTGALVEVIDMPAADGHVFAAALAAQLQSILSEPRSVGDGVTAWVEDVHSMPGQGVASTFKFGRSVGVVVGVLGALAVPVRWVSPAQWKRASGLGKDKGASRRRAQELWPDHASLFARVRDDGRAEAALIAMYGRKAT